MPSKHEIALFGEIALCYRPISIKDLTPSSKVTMLKHGHGLTSYQTEDIGIVTLVLPDGSKREVSLYDDAVVVWRIGPVAFVPSNVTL